MRKLLTPVAVATLTLSAAACSKPAQTQMANAEANASSPTQNGTDKTMAKASDVTAVAQDSAAAVVGTVGGVTGAATPASFVDNASQDSLLDVEAAKMAMERSKSASIKAFARKAVAEHTAQLASLKAAASTSGASDAKLASALDDRRQGLLDNLKHASADDFDPRYLDQQAAMHREEAELMKTYAKTGSNAALKTYADKTAATVDQHLAEIVALDKANADHDAPNTKSGA